MDIRVLGPLSLAVDGQVITPSAAKPRQVLATLLLHANKVVPVSALIAELWDDTPPVSALTTLQTYVLQLRRSLRGALAPASQRVSLEILVTRTGGYLFRVQPGELDLDAFLEKMAEGRRWLAQGDNELATRRLGEALDLWSGPALVDIKAGRLIEAEILHLEECRVAVLEQRIEADLRLGRHHEILAELAGLTAKHRMHENLHAQLMVALYRSGRRPHALDVFHRLRSALIDELGLEPSSKMQRLHQALLSSDPVLDRPLRGDGLLLDQVAIAGC
ncbi:AfsR/SARP family transcriptional regulator [Kutzneria sp. NPDC051319]|uniref:AfsR/SARP family transcriptional regulator n=1 Tax=Kutzneria sp. NPDC051319 TaxID=3155047 RepID=UPI00343B47FA